MMDILQTKRSAIKTQGVGMNEREWREYFCLFTAERNFRELRKCCRVFEPISGMWITVSKIEVERKRGGN